MIKGIVFDMDGLLIDSEPVWFRARCDLFEQYGLTWSWSDQKHTMGVSTSDWVQFMAERLQGKLSSQAILNGVVKRMTTYYEAGEIDVLPGAQEALEFCRGKYILGLASGSYGSLIHAALKGANWSHYFREVLSSDEVSAGKPSPVIYLEIARRMGVLPEQTVVLEDSGNGILAGHAAGARVIAVPSKHSPPPEEVLSKADIVIDSLVSFQSALGELTEGLS